MDTREQYINNIKRKLSYLKNEIEISSSLNLTDINIHAENFFRDLLNILGSHYENTNFTTKNSKAIDLIDHKNKKAIQITSQNTCDKICNTIKGFYSNKKYSRYKLKILLISKESKKYRKDFSYNGKYPFSADNDIIDLSHLFAVINNENTPCISKISKFFDNEISFSKKPTECNEVETIMELLRYLSDDRNYEDFDASYKCDPEQKINHKFKKYASSFKEEYAELVTTYQTTVSEAKKEFGIDSVRAFKISQFLNYISNRYLRENNNNPLTALDKLTDYFEDKLNKNGIRADICAIRFYMLDELIGCNVFSTKIN